MRDVVGGLRPTADDPRAPVQIQRARPRFVLAVAVHPDAEERERLDLETGFLAQLAANTVQRMLVLVEEAAGKVPSAVEDLARAAREEDAALVVDAEGAGGRTRIRVLDEPAGPAIHAALSVLEVGAASGARDPVVERRHGRQE
jgi:hypothetical protein